MLALLDITPYARTYPELGQENFFEGAVSTTQYDGKTVGVPWYTEAQVLFYRTDLLAEVGYEDGPKTWGTWRMQPRSSQPGEKASTELLLVIRNSRYPS